MGFNISENGKNFIKGFEQLRLNSYRDQGGVWTIGYGSTGNHVGPGMSISEGEAEELFMDDLVRFERAVNQHVKVPIQQNQYDMMVSLAFNVGEGKGGFATSTGLEKLNNGDLEGASKAFSWFNKVTIKGKGKVTSNGLVRRRKEESAIFLGGKNNAKPNTTPIISSKDTIQGSTGGNGLNIVWEDRKEGEENLDGFGRDSQYSSDAIVEDNTIQGSSGDEVLDSRDTVTIQGSSGDEVLDSRDATVIQGFSGDEDSIEEFLPYQPTAENTPEGAQTPNEVTIQQERAEIIQGLVPTQGIEDITGAL